MESYIHERFFYDDTVLQKVQTKVQQLIPAKVQKVLTETIRMMVQTISAGSNFIKPKLKETTWSLQRRDDEVRKKWMSTKNSSGRRSRTGAGGILLGLADFPLYLQLKLNFYSMQRHCTDLIRVNKKSVFFLHVFQLAFSSDDHRKKYGKQSKRGIQKKKIIWTGKSSKQSTETILI